MNRILLNIWLFGFISGSSLMLVTGTMNYWLASKNIDVKTIGLLALLSIPYSINFLWAPLLDTYKIYKLANLLGQRLAFIYVIQILLGTSVFAISFIDLKLHLLSFSIIGFAIAFFSSTQDTLLGAYRTEIVAGNLQKSVSGIYIFGYRIGMLLFSSGLIYMSSYYSFAQLYRACACLILFYPFLLNISLPKKIITTYRKSNYDGKLLSYLFNNILKPIGSTKFIILTIIFLILYRAADNLINQMIHPFLLHLNYDNKEIAIFGRFLGLFSSIIGSLLASLWRQNKNILDNLLLYGCVHSIVHLLFIWQEHEGHNIYLLSSIICLESLTSGMTMTVYIAYIASLCSGKFRATQYSLLSSSMGLSRVLLPALSGYIVYNSNWSWFFMIVFLSSIPSLLLLLKLKKMLKSE